MQCSAGPGTRSITPQFQGLFRQDTNKLPDLSWTVHERATTKTDFTADDGPKMRNGDERNRCTLPLEFRGIELAWVAGKAWSFAMTLTIIECVSSSPIGRD